MIPLQMTMIKKEQRAAQFVKFYGSDDPKLLQRELQALSRADAEEYLDKADVAYQDARVIRLKILNEQGKEMHMSDVTYEKPKHIQLETIKSEETIPLTIIKRVKCLHCSKTASCSCLVETAEIVLQLVCNDHETGIIIWRKED